MGWRSRGRQSYRGYNQWPEYVPVHQRMAKARETADRLARGGEKLEPVTIQGRTIARTFWGKSWCAHLESYSDYSNRLPRGRSYLSNGLVVDLKIQAGHITARVSGTSLYTIDVKIQPLSSDRWNQIRASCAGRIGTLVELLQGRLADDVMRRMCDRATGLFPAPREIELSCSCPDWATMCKHVAATLYGVGARLDSRPELLFVLRGVDHAELIQGAVGAAIARPGATAGSDGLEAANLGELFGIDLGEATPAARTPAARDSQPAPRAGSRRAPPAREPVESPERAGTIRQPALEGPGVRPRRAGSRAADPLDLFLVGEEVLSSELAAIGIPATLYYKWAAGGILQRTGRRGVYRATPSLNAAVLEALVALE